GIQGEKRPMNKTENGEESQPLFSGFSKAESFNTLFGPGITLIIAKMAEQSGCATSQASEQKGLGQGKLVGFSSPQGNHVNGPWLCVHLCPDQQTFDTAIDDCQAQDDYGGGA